MKKNTIAFITAILITTPLIAKESDAIDKPVVTTASGTHELGTIVINQDQFSKQDFQIYARTRLSELKQQGEVSQDKAKQLIEELVTITLLSQDAIKQGLDQDPTVKQAIKMSRYQILSQVALARYMDIHPITEKEKAALYEQYLVKRAKKEYKVRFIEVETETAANDALKKLKSGTDFETLAKKVSTDPSSVSGGDLGWYIPRDKNSAFANAVRSTAVGTYTQAPIKTKLGWGIILIEKIRDLPAYKKEDVYPKITKIIRQQRVVQYLTDLNKAATIKMLQVDGKEINFKAQ